MLPSLPFKGGGGKELGERVSSSPAELENWQPSVLQLAVRCALFLIEFERLCVGLA